LRVACRVTDRPTCKTGDTREEERKQHDRRLGDSSLQATTTRHLSGVRFRSTVHAGDHLNRPRD
jgi:hypothetical protein